MRSLTDISTDLAEFLVAARRCIDSGDYRGACQRLDACLAAFRVKERSIDEIRQYRDWLNECLNIASIARNHLAHEATHFARPAYGRAERTSLWSVRG